jgi:hypothetical protein
MAPRSNRDDDGLAPDTGRYRDDVTNPSSEDDETVGRDDALSFLAIDGEDGGPGDGGLSPLQQKHILHRYIPPRVRQAWKAIVKWCKGPDPPRPWKIRPFFESVQTAPIRLLDAICPKAICKFWLLMAFYATWFLVFSLVLWKSAFIADVPGFGAPINIGCGARFW